MKRLSDEIIQFFHDQSFVVVSSIGRNGSLHNSCKGIVKISKSGAIYLLDLYMARTYDNLKKNPNISITGVDEHRFKGFCLKGKAKIIEADKIKAPIIKAWGERITSRITQRVLKNMHEDKGHPRHPEALLPQPQYVILMQVKEIVDLTPNHIK